MAEHHFWKQGPGLKNLTSRREATSPKLVASSAERTSRSYGWNGCNTVDTVDPVHFGRVLRTKVAEWQSTSL